MTLDGKPVAKAIRAHVRQKTEELGKRGITPTLAIIIATDDEGAQWYVRSLHNAGDKCGVNVKVISLSPDSDSDAIVHALRDQANDESIHGVMLQAPLPDHVSLDELLPLIPVDKDVDGVSPLSAGLLADNLNGFIPATAEAVIKILEYYHVTLKGKHAVVVGRSRVVGKPVAQLLLQADSTVTICHSRTPDLRTFTIHADIVIAAAGQPGLIKVADIRSDSIVIDVGTNVTSEGTLVGDVDPAVADKASLSPVPGGVGPVTTALLLLHTIVAAS